MRATKSPIHAVSTWVRRQPPKVKVFLAVASGITALVLLKFIVHDHDNLFVAAESVHSIGISLLIYKLTKEKTCAACPRPGWIRLVPPLSLNGLISLETFYVL
uniref:Uncharacterized protein n=1 Tax=Brassica oleracea var. oleracea TaxID=109376 RepID=A0A0D3DW94_BRAOL